MIGHKKAKIVKHKSKKTMTIILNTGNIGVSVVSDQLCHCL